MRHGHIDIARGWCITLVVLGHGAVGWFHPDVDRALSNVRMPLMLALAGAHLRPASPWVTARDKADALLKPLLVVAALLAGHAALRGDVVGPEAWADHLGRLATFNGLDMPGWLFPLWFLSLLWLLHVSASLVATALPRVHASGWPHAGWLQTWHRQQPVWTHHLLWPLSSPRALLWLALLAACWRLGTAPFTAPDFTVHGHMCSGSGLSHRGWRFNADLLPLGGACFALGYLAKDWLQHAHAEWRTTGCWAVVSLAIWVLWSPELHMLEREVQAPWASLALALSGSLTLLGLARGLCHWTACAAASAWLGRRSLYILLFHAPAQWAVFKVLRSSQLMGDEGAAWLAGAAVILALASLGGLVQRHPWVMACFEPFSRVAKQARSARLGRAQNKQPVHNPLDAAEPSPQHQA